MFKKIAAIVNHPYAAPVTETFKGIFKIAYAPLEGFIEDLTDGWKNTDDDSSRFLGAYAGIFHGDSDSSIGYGIVGAIFGAIGLGIAGGVLAAGSGVAAIVGGVVAGIGIGVAAGPFAAATVVGAAAAVVGSVVGGVPGFIHGVSKIFDYHSNREAYEQAMQALPQTSAKDELAKRVAPALAEFNDLSKDDREPFVRMMNEAFEGAYWDRTERIVKAVDAMPESQRVALAEVLKDKLKLAFEPAVQKPDPAVEQDDDDGPIIAPKTASFSRSRKAAVVTP